MTLVLDTNVLLAAFGTRGLCEALLEICLAEHELCISQPILDELKKHLTGKFKLTASRTSEILAFCRKEFRLVTPAAVDENACRDPTDLMVLGAAVAGRAAWIVTGDQDLLVLNRYERVQILSPRAAYVSLQTKRGKID